MATAKSGLKRAPAKRRAKKAKADTRGLTPAECRLDLLSGVAEQVRERVVKEGGEIIGTYKDPLGGGCAARLHPAHRESRAHAVPARPFATCTTRSSRTSSTRPASFSIPIIASPRRRKASGRRTAAPADGDAAARREVDHRAGGAQARDRLADPRAQHREGAQPAREVARSDPHLSRADRRGPKRAESGFSFYLEEASFVTLGICYEKNGKFAGGAYNSIVRRLEKFSDEPIGKALKAHEKHAEMLMELDARVAEVVTKLKAKGFVSPYLRAFVVARINPLRWIQGDPPPLEEVLKTMRERAAKFNTEKIKQEDLASAGGAADDAD